VEKQKTIDGASRDVVQYDVPLQDLEVNVEFTDDLEREESDVSHIQVTTDILGLVQGVKIARIEREGLWRQGGYDNLRSYRIAQLERLGIPRSTLSVRRIWGEAWIDYNKVLRKLPIRGNCSKLNLFDAAMRTHEAREVLDHFKRDSLREWESWVRPALPLPSDLPDVEVSIEGDEILLDGVPMLAFDEDLGAEERGFLAGMIKDVYRVRRGALVPHVVGCYDASEARWVEKALREHRASK
jgi:hypothetical protein